MNRSLGTCLVVMTLSTPSCLVYDQALLDEAVGGSETAKESGGNPGIGGDGSGGDVSGADGGTGAVISSGGGDGDGGGAGGDTPAGGDQGADGGTGGSGGSGGSDGTGGEPPACTEPSGQKGGLTDVGETSLIEDFNRAWSSIGAASPYTGQWFIARDPGGTGIPAAMKDVQDQDPCSAKGDKALHVVGTGYTTWGASFDANLMFDVAEIDVSMYTGVTFWARSDDFDQLKIGFSDGDDSNGTTPIETTPQFIGAVWSQYWVHFPASVKADRMTVVHLVASADAAFDFWLDDLTFYVEP